MNFVESGCEICERRPAAVFMVVRQDRPGGREHVAKAHVCFRCFELVQARDEVSAEAVSLREWKES